MAKTKALVELTDKTAGFLRKFNIAAGILHLIQGILMVVLSNDTLSKIYISLPEPNLETRSAFPVLEEFFEVNLGPVVATFLFMSALAHFIIASPGVNKWYNENLKLKRNYARWYEYALSSSVMLVLVAVLSNVVDFNALILIFVLNACMNLFGLSMEKHNSLKQQMDPNAKTDWTEYIYGVIAGFTPWIVVGTYFFVTLDRVDGQVVNGVTIEIPDFVTWIFWSLIVTFNTFAINMFLQYMKIGPWKNYLFGEKVYIVLSFVAKSLLAWQVWGGTLR
jgi:hypothetical protein